MWVRCREIKIALFIIISVKKPSVPIALEFDKLFKALIISLLLTGVKK